MSDNWSEFTEAGFDRMLGLLVEGGYTFARFDAEPVSGRHVLWRHDVDFSVHRASRLAAIEAENGAVATYFFNPRSSFYNLAEPEVLRLVREIRRLGHQVGLHFDSAAHGVEHWTKETLEAAVGTERRLIECILEDLVTTVSWHNPDQSNLLDFGSDIIAGLTNAYADRLRRNYVYASDSNGFWRFQPMVDVITKGYPHLHLLTHPEWWTPTPLSPSARVDRCIVGRAAAVRDGYDAQLRRAGRPNIGAPLTEEG